MNNYKDHIRRSMGLTEAQFISPSKLKTENFPGIDPEDWSTAAKREKGEDENISPTARPTPIIALGVRGSSSGGLPSGIDQGRQDISPTKVGGYDRVTTQNLNSKLVDKTPQNPEIKQETNPINQNPSTGKGITHPHQIQVTAHEEPQVATGASTDSDDTLKLKSAVPKGIDIDITDEGSDESDEEVKNENNNTAMIPSTSLSETFERNKQLMRKKLGLKGAGDAGDVGDWEDLDIRGGRGPEHPLDNSGKGNIGSGGRRRARHGLSDLPPDPDDIDEIMTEGKHKAGGSCGFCKNKGNFGKKKKEEQEEGCKEEQEESKEEQDEVKKQQKLDESYAAPFQRMRSLAGVGNMILTSNGLMENKNDPGANKPFNTNWKMDEKKAGFVKIDEEKLNRVKASLERKSKRGTLSDEEFELAKKLTEVLKRRQAKV